VTASLAAMGRTGGFGSPPLTLIDIGGGSTEIIVRRPATKPRTVSLPLGAVYLTERFIRTDPPAVQALNGMRDAVREELFRSIKLIQPASAGLFIGTAGTISTLAAIVQGLETYDAARIDRTVLDREAVDDIVRTLGSMTVRERTSVRGLEPGREDIILAGAVIAQEIMRWSRHTSLLVIEWGLREGIVLDLAEKLNQKHRSARVGRLEKRQRE
jgi:exopolyphosphatase/guanosine-5'-triphosphate,3'-diphosphate pyrophosphatase